jgi:dihydroorotase
MSQILDLLRPGDILPHSYSGAPNIAGAFTNIVQEGKLLPAALAAKQRGVIFDVGHGGGSFDYTIAEVAIPGGCAPDTISSDIHVFSGNTPGMPYLPWVMSKFMGLSFTLEQVVAMATINPAKIINRVPKLGTLQVGARRRRDHGAGRRAGIVRRHAQQQARGQGPPEASANRDRRGRVRTALRFAVLGAMS